MDSFLSKILAIYRSGSSSAIDAMDSGLADQFIQNISSIMLNARFSDDSFLFNKPCDSEPAKPDKKLSCCTHVNFNQKIRRCFMAGTKLAGSPFVGCEQHTTEYVKLREQKRVSCENAQAAFQAFEKLPTVENAQNMLRYVYECLETRIIIMHRYFRPYTDCENAYEGHVLALRWFTPAVLQASVTVIKENDRKTRVQEEISAEITEMVEESVEQHVDEEMSASTRRNVKKRASQKRKKLQARVEQAKKDNEAIFFMTTMSEYESSRIRVRDEVKRQSNSVVGSDFDDELPTDPMIKYEHYEDGTHKFEYSPYHEVVNSMFKEYLSSQFQSQVPGSWTLTCVVEEFKSTQTNKLSFKRPKLYGLFQKGNIVGVGKWNVEEAGYLEEPKVTCPATLVHRVSQVYMQAINMKVGSTLVMINLVSRSDLNGEKVTVLEIREDGRYNVRINSSKKSVVAKTQNLKVDSPLPNILGPVNELGNVALWPATFQGVQLAKDMFFNAFDDKWRAPDYVCVSKNVVESHHGKRLDIKFIDQSVFDKSKTHNSTLILENSTVPDKQMRNHETLSFTFAEKAGVVNDNFIKFTKYVSHETPREYRRRDAKVNDAFKKHIEAMNRELEGLQLNL